MRKVYRLFGIPIWIVETEGEPDDDDEDSEQVPSSLIERSNGEPPIFGFINLKDTYE